MIIQEGQVENGLAGFEIIAHMPRPVAVGDRYQEARGRRKQPPASIKDTQT